MDTDNDDEIEYSEQGGTIVACMRALRDNLWPFEACMPPKLVNLELVGTRFSPDLSERQHHSYVASQDVLQHAVRLR